MAMGKTVGKGELPTAWVQAMGNGVKQAVVGSEGRRQFKENGPDE